MAILPWRPRRSGVHASAKLAGYSSSEIAEIVLRKTTAFLADRPREITASGEVQNFLFGITYAALRSPERPLRVLDFGGACGLSAGISRLVLPDLPMRWAVVETGAMVDAARRDAPPDTGFFTSISGAAVWLGRVDFVLCAGTLQYVADPPQTIRDLLALAAPTLLWSRTALSPEKGRTTAEVSMLSAHSVGPMPEGFADAEVRIPVNYMPEAEFLAAHRGYDLVWKFPSAHAWGDLIFAGYLFRAKPHTR